MARISRVGPLLVLVASSAGCSGLLHAAAHQIGQDHPKGAPPYADVAGPAQDDRPEDATTTSAYEYGPTPSWKLYTVLGPYLVQRSVYSPPTLPTWQCERPSGDGPEPLHIQNAYLSRSLMANGPLRFSLATGSTPVHSLFTADRDAAAGRGRPPKIYVLGSDTSCGRFIFLEADWSGGKTPPTRYR